jgi:phosphoglycerate kinase
LSHRGRPNGNHSKDDSLVSFAGILQKRLKKAVIFSKKIGFLKNIKTSKYRIFLLENLRFWPGEDRNDPKFARKLAILGDFYVNEAFPASHRNSASISAITRFLPSYMGLRFEEEIKQLRRALTGYKKPLTLILGGAKISDKIGVIKYFWHKADNILLAGGPANTFLAASGLPVGDSLVNGDAKVFIKPYLNSPKIKLPIDLKIHTKSIMDIGPKTLTEYSKIIRKSRTIIWNGPAGFFEKKEFSNGTKGIWQAILRNKKARIVVGGGETVASLSLIHNSQFMIPRNLFLSTGGGAMLEYLSGKKLPGITALK